MSPQEPPVVRPDARRINQPVTPCAKGSVRDFSKKAAFMADGEVGLEQDAEELQQDPDVDHEEVESEEVQPVRSAPSPEMPSPAEIEAHRESHLPYRSWCQDCVLGRAIGQMHKRKVAKSSGVAVVAMDYFFMTPTGLHLKDQAEQEAGGPAFEEAVKTGKIVKCLIMKCRTTKAVAAFVVPQKGIDPDRYASDRVTAFIEWLGHTKVIIKGDGEPAMKALIRDSLKVLRVLVQDVEQASEEHSPEYDSRANGDVEAAIRRLRELFRTARSCLQHRLEKNIEVDHPIMSWLLEHTAMLMTALVKGPDGTTAWQKARGREFGMRSVCFGEECAFKKPGKGPRYNARGNMVNQSEMGTFLGYNRSSNQYIYATDEGVKMSRSIQRRPLEQRWHVDKIAGVVSTPWSMRQVRDREALFREPDARGARDQAQAAENISTRP